MIQELREQILVWLRNSGRAFYTPIFKLGFMGISSSFLLVLYFYREPVVSGPAGAGVGGVIQLAYH